MANSSNLLLPYLAAAQAQKHVTVNESLQRLDALVQLSVVSATTAAQPGSPTDGQVYILPIGKTGASWGAMANSALAYWRDGVWDEIAPREGWVAFVEDTDRLCYYTGAAWALFPAPKLITVSATDRVLGRISASAGDAEEIIFTDQAQQLCDDASFAAMRTTLAAPGLADANTFTAAQVVSISSGTTALTLRLTDDGAGVGPYLVLDRLSASPAANDFGPSLYFQARDGGGNAMLLAELRTQIIDATDGSEDGRLSVFTLVAGANAARLRIDAGLYHPSATGGDKGDNTINFGAVYDDNTLLTCFVLEYANTGALDLAYWDSLSPSGRHEPAHRFWAERDLLNLDAYVRHWRFRGHLPGMPSRKEWAEHGRDKRPVGDMVSRLWQTVEMHAVHIAQLNERLRALEARFDAP